MAYLYITISYINSGAATHIKYIWFFARNINGRLYRIAIDVFYFAKKGEANTRILKYKNEINFIVLKLAFI